MATKKDLYQILTGEFDSHPKDLRVYSFDGGYLLKKDAFDLPLDFYMKGGLAYFNEYYFDDILEFSVYIKAYWNIDLWGNKIRFGLGEGLSYTTDILEAEYLEALADGEPTSLLLNYLDISVDFDIGRLIGYEPLYETYIGCATKHRSGVFGLFNGSDGGSNYNIFYIEKNW